MSAGENDDIRNYFDEESGDNELSFISPTSDFNQSELDLGREPLASSSKRLTNQQINKNSPKKKPKPKSKRRSKTSKKNLSKETFHDKNLEESRSRRKQKKPKKLVLKEIRKYQKSTELLVPKLPFSRVIKEILMSPHITTNSDLRITPKALEALQESAEIYLTIFFEDSYRCSIHRGRITLIVKDMELVRALRGVDDLGYRKPR